MACTCAMMETLWDYCPREVKPWWQNTAQIGSKMLYLPKPSQYVWIVPITSILGRLPLVPAGQKGTIPHSMHARQQECFKYGECDKADEPGTGRAAWSSISIRGQWSFHQIIQWCSSKHCSLSCNEVAHAPAMACQVCASVPAISIRLGGYTGRHERIQTTIDQN